MYVGLSDSEEIIKNEEITNSFDESSELLDTHDMKDLINSNDELSFLVKSPEVGQLTHSFDDSTCFLDTHDDRKMVMTCEEISSITDNKKKDNCFVEKFDLTANSHAEQSSCHISSPLSETGKKKSKENYSEEASFMIEKQKKSGQNSQHNSSSRLNTPSDEECFNSMQCDPLNSIVDTENDVDEEWSLDREVDFIGQEMTISETLKTKTEPKLPFSFADDEKKIEVSINDNNGCMKVVQHRSVASSTDKIGMRQAINTDCLLPKLKKPRQRYKVRFFSYPKKSEIDSSQTLNPKKQYFEIHIRPERLVNSSEFVNHPKLTSLPNVATVPPSKTHQVKEIKVSATEKLNEHEKEAEWDDRRLKSKEKPKQPYHKKQDTYITNGNNFYRYPDTNTSNACSFQQSSQEGRGNIKRWISKFFRYLKRVKPRSSVQPNRKWTPSLLNSNPNYFLYDLDRKGVINEIHNITQRINVLTQNECQPPNTVSCDEIGAEKFGTNRSNIFSFSTSQANAYSPTQHRVLKRKIVDVTHKKPCVGTEFLNNIHGEIFDMPGARKTQNGNDLRIGQRKKGKNETYDNTQPNFRQERMRTVRFANIRSMSQSESNAHNRNSLQETAVPPNRGKAEDETSTSFKTDDFELDQNNRENEKKSLSLLGLNDWSARFEDKEMFTETEMLNDPTSMQQKPKVSKANKGEKQRQKALNNKRNKRNDPDFHKITNPPEYTKRKSSPFITSESGLEHDAVLARQQQNSMFSSRKNASQASLTKLQGCEAEPKFYSEDNNLDYASIIPENNEPHYRQHSSMPSGHTFQHDLALHQDQRNLVPKIQQDSNQHPQHANSVIYPNQYIQQGFDQNPQHANFVIYPSQYIQQGSDQNPQHANSVIYPSQYIQQGSDQNPRHGKSVIYPSQYIQQGSDQNPRHAKSVIYPSQYLQKGSDQNPHHAKSVIYPSQYIQQGSDQNPQSKNFSISSKQHIQQDLKQYQNHRHLAPNIQHKSIQHRQHENPAIYPNECILQESSESDNQNDTAISPSQFNRKESAPHYDKKNSETAVNDSPPKHYQHRDSLNAYFDKDKTPLKIRKSKPKSLESKSSPIPFPMAQEVSLRFIETFQEESKKFLEALVDSFFSKLFIDTSSLDRSKISKDLVNRYDFDYESTLHESSALKGATFKTRAASCPSVSPKTQRKMSLDATESNRLSKGFEPNAVGKSSHQEDEEKFSFIDSRRRSIHRASTNEEEFLMQLLTCSEQAPIDNKEVADVLERYTDEQKQMMQTLKAEAKEGRRQRQPSNSSLSLTVEEDFLMQSYGNVASKKSMPAANNEITKKKGSGASVRHKQKENCNTKEIQEGSESRCVEVEPKYKIGAFRIEEDGPGQRIKAGGETMRQLIDKSPCSGNFQKTVFRKRQKKSKIAPCCINPDSAPSPPYNNGCPSAKPQYEFHPVIKTYDSQPREIARKLLGEATDSNDEEHHGNVDNDKNLSMDRNMGNKDTRQSDYRGDVSGEKPKDDARNAQSAEEQLQERRQWAMQMARLMNRGAIQRQEVVATHNLRFHPHISKDQLQSEMQNKIIYAHSKGAAANFEDKESIPVVPMKRDELVERMGHLNTAIISKMQPSHDEMKAIRNATRCVKEIARLQEWRLFETSNSESSLLKNASRVEHRGDRERRGRIGLRG